MRNNYAPNGRQSHCLTSETANTMNPEKWSKDGDGPLIATMPVAAMLGVAGVISLSEDWMTALKEIRENIIGSLVVWVVGSQSKTDTVVLSPRELIRRKRIDELRSLLGSVTLDIDIAQSRRRPRQVTACKRLATGR